jgi:hypothetical protein
VDRSFPALGADELLDGFTRWRERQALEPLARIVLVAILQEFVARGGPVDVAAVPRLVPAAVPGDVDRAVRNLDEKDMIVVEDGRVTVAYPFSAAPTPFEVALGDGRRRYAVCAIDALGVAPMLGTPISIRSRCHHCREPLALEVAPEGPMGGDAVLVWLGPPRGADEKAYRTR